MSSIDRAYAIYAARPSQACCARTLTGVLREMQAPVGCGQSRDMNTADGRLNVIPGAMDAPGPAKRRIQPQQQAQGVEQSAFVAQPAAGEIDEPHVDAPAAGNGAGLQPAALAAILARLSACESRADEQQQVIKNQQQVINKLQKTVGACCPHLGHLDNEVRKFPEKTSFLRRRQTGS